MHSHNQLWRRRASRPRRLLAWSFNRDGEAKPNPVEDRDKKLGIDSQEKRRERQELVKLAKPQFGVDALDGKCTGPTKEIPGVCR